MNLLKSLEICTYIEDSVENRSSKYSCFHESTVVSLCLQSKWTLLAAIPQQVRRLVQNYQSSSKYSDHVRRILLELTNSWIWVNDRLVSKVRSIEAVRFRSESTRLIPFQYQELYKIRSIISTQVYGCVTNKMLMNIQLDFDFFSPFFNIINDIPEIIS